MLIIIYKSGHEKQQRSQFEDVYATFIYICVVILARYKVCYVFNINLWSDREWILSYKIQQHTDNKIDDEKFSTSTVSYVPGMTLYL